MHLSTVRCALAAALAALLSSGCAGQMKVTPQEIRAAAFKPNRSATRPIKMAAADLAFNTDKPSGEIGEAKTGLFNRSTPIVTEEPANLIVSNAIKKGLMDAGLLMAEPADADFKLEGSLERFWVSEYATGWTWEYAKALVRYDIILKDPNGKILWADTIELFKTSSEKMDATQEDIPTLRAALEESVTQLLEDEGFWKALGE